MISLRPWRVEDAAFVCHLRNDPKLMQWYRQDRIIELEEQKEFIRNDKTYNGQIVELFEEPVGVMAIQKSGELSIVLDELYYVYLPELLAGKKCWGEVMLQNPILRYLLNAGMAVVDLGRPVKGSPTLLVISE